MLIFVCLPSLVYLKLSIFIFLAQTPFKSTQTALSKHSESTQQALSDYSEPKILCLILDLRGAQ